MSLQGLISSVMEPESTPEEVEDILARRTIRWTLHRCRSKLYLMSDLMTHVRSLRGHRAHAWMKYLDGQLAAVVDAFFTRRASVAELRAVCKLHNVGKPQDFLELSRPELTVLQKVILAPGREPLYPWLGPYWLDGEGWSNALNVTETRSFLAFISRAWEENLPCPRIGDDWLLEGLTAQPKFRDFEMHENLATAVRRKARQWRTPCVFRDWF